MSRTTAPTLIDQDELFRLLADPLRAQIVALLSVEQLCTCHLVDATGAGQSNVSNHLRALRQAGLVETEPHGRFTYYRLNPAPLAVLADVMTRLAADARQALKNKMPCE